MNDAQRADRGRRANHALEEFLDPAFDVVRTEYADRLKHLCATEPWAANKIAAMANATRVVEEVRKQIAYLVIDGKEAGNAIERVKTIERMSPERRKILGI